MSQGAAALVGRPFVSGGARLREEAPRPHPGLRRTAVAVAVDNATAVRSLPGLCGNGLGTHDGAASFRAVATPIVKTRMREGDA